MDDHALLRDGVALMLRMVDDSVEVLHAANLEQGLGQLRCDDPPQLVLLDLGLPDAVGLEGVRHMRAAADEAVIVVLSGVDDQATMRECIAAGAMGFIHKSSTSGQMLESLRRALAGEVVLPDGVHEAAAPAVPAMLRSLTRRQREVLACVVVGMTNKAIATRLHITELTVKSHVTAVLQTLGVSNRTEAVYAVRHLPWRQLD